MKLNNKGFAITTVLYGLLILFVLLMASYFTILTAKKNKLDNITKSIEDDYYFNIKKEVNENISYPYDVIYTGKYVFNSDCIMYLYAGNTLTAADNKCNTLLREIYYHGDDNNE